MRKKETLIKCVDYLGLGTYKYIVKIPMNFMFVRE